MIKKNAPYVKKYENGILVNPITKENPYLNNPNISILKQLLFTENSKNRMWQSLSNRFFKGKTPVIY